jgi:hypothetical protein
MASRDSLALQSVPTVARAVAAEMGLATAGEAREVWVVITPTAEKVGMVAPMGATVARVATPQAQATAVREALVGTLQAVWLVLVEMEGMPRTETGARAVRVEHLAVPAARVAVVATVARALVPATVVALVA